MGSRKRRRETDMAIKIASGDSIEADSLLVRTSCDSARGLPAPADVWDVSGLLLDGQPFSRETVSCWLSCACSAVHGLGELGEQDKQQLSTVAGLTQVLAFADAVGSYEGLYNAACSQMEELKFIVQLPEQALQLLLEGSNYRLQIRAKQVMQFTLQQQAKLLVGAPLATVEQWRDVQQEVAKQLSSLLKLAHGLCLLLLLDMLHEFVFCNTWAHQALLSDGLGLVFSDAVLEAAQGSSTLSKEAYVSSVLSQPCSLTPDLVGNADDSRLLKPVGVPTYLQGIRSLMFDAQLQRDFAGGKAGDTVKMVVDLLEGGQVRLGARKEDVMLGGAVVLPAQLLLGRSFSDEAALVNFLHPVDEDLDGEDV